MLLIYTCCVSNNSGKPLQGPLLYLQCYLHGSGRCPGNLILHHMVLYSSLITVRAYLHNEEGDNVSGNTWCMKTCLCLKIPHALLYSSPFLSESSELNSNIWTVWRHRDASSSFPFDQQCCLTHFVEPSLCYIVWWCRVCFGVWLFHVSSISHPQTWYWRVKGGC